MKKNYTIIIALFLLNLAFGQQQYSGAGNFSNITITSSNIMQNPNWQNSANAENTVNGSGLMAKQFEASRFLSQATMGYDKTDIDNVVALGLENWLDEQLDMPPSLTYDLAYSLWQTEKTNTYNDPDKEFDPPNSEEWINSIFDFAWWQNILTKEDILHQRVAFAFSEIFVISRNSNLRNRGNGLATFYDVLVSYQDKTFEELLYDITLDSSMGYYLSVINSQKPDPTINRFPDENYAREIMQLFSIGLYELNLDGSHKKDVNGESIPTYTQEEIKELARTLTGFGTGATAVSIWNSAPPPPAFDLDLFLRELAVPMAMYDNYHDVGEKTIVRNKIIEADKTGLYDVKQAIKTLSEHSNVGPFLAYRMIQRLVKSNPSPQYIERVAKVFNNNGNGVRGDLKAFIKAILMDSEARNCDASGDFRNGKLREPFKRYTHFCNYIKTNSANNLDFFNTGGGYFKVTGQNILEAPSVFNFYLPNFTPNGEISDHNITNGDNLVAPEFNIHNSTTSIGYINEVNKWLTDKITRNWSNGGPLDELTVDYLYYQDLANDTEELINELDLVFTYGKLTDVTRDILRTSINQIDNTIPDYLEERMKMAIYLIMISPDYNIMH